MRRNTIRAVLLLAMAFLLLTGCSQDALVGTRVEAAHMSFILPEGWDYKEDVFSFTYPYARRATEYPGIVSLFPPSRDAEDPILSHWQFGPYLMNVSYFIQQRPPLLTGYEAGMTLDEWVEGKLYNMPEELYHIEQQRLCDEVHMFYVETIMFDTIPDQVAYLFVRDDLAVMLCDGGMTGLTQEEQWMLIGIIESLQPLE